MNRLAGRAVFAHVKPELDKTAGALAEALGIDGYPAASVLEPNPEQIVETLRTKGFFRGDAFARHLAGVLGEPTGGSQAQALLTPLAKTAVDPAQCAERTQ